ncbi:hypothetical protein PTKIN_Ptkin19aG0028600 [Pterospermum kingtungense]
MWLLHANCESVISRAWQNHFQGSPSFILMRKLKATKEALKHRIRYEFGFLQRRRNKLEHKFQELQSNMSSSSVAETEQETRKELLLLDEQEQLYWMQKSRIQWIIQGDHNTRFYHTVTSRRRMRNFIPGLYTANGDWIDDHDLISESFTNHFKSTFNEPQLHSEDQIRSWLEDIGLPKLNEACVQRLNQPFTIEEIREALFQIGPLKGPGIDGAPAIFYQKMWHIVGESTTNAVVSFLNSGHLLKEFNKTLITLIPKIDCHKELINTDQSVFVLLFIRSVQKLW